MARMATFDWTVLDVDVGNSRIKWRVRGLTGQDVGCMDRLDPSVSDSWPSIRVDRVRVSSVASKNENEELGRSLAQRFGCVAEFAMTTRVVDGLTCGYDEPARLGVDRWLAMLGARQIASGPFVVIDAGTAATVDFVSAEGAHQGGFIVPGLRLMASALFRGTADVQVSFEPNDPVVRPGKTTTTAVRGGLVLMLTDFASNAVARFTNDCGVRPHVYVCGGDAELIAPLIQGPSVIKPHLVLDGLELALP